MLLRSLSSGARSGPRLMAVYRCGTGSPSLRFAPQAGLGSPLVLLRGQRLPALLAHADPHVAFHLVPDACRPAVGANKHYVRHIDRRFLLRDPALGPLPVLPETVFLTTRTCSTRTVPLSGNTRSTRPVLPRSEPVSTLTVSLR